MFQILRIVSPKLGTGLIWLLLVLFSTSQVLADQFDHLTHRVSGTRQDLRAVAFGEGGFVALGAGGTILTSTNSADWSSQPSGITNHLTGVVYGNGLFVAVGDARPAGTATILTSADSIAWTPRASGTANNLKSIAFGNGAFVAVGDMGTVLYSSDATNWAARITGVPYALNGVCYGRGTFVAIGDNGTILTSPDGLAWTARFSGIFFRLNGAIPGNFEFVAVGDTGAVASSPDGITWTLRTSGTTNDLLGIAFDQSGNYGGAGGRNVPGTYGIVGRQGTFLTSPDSVNWAQQPTDTTKDLYGVTYEDGGFLAVGAEGTIQAGFIWLKRDSGVTADLSTVIYGKGKFLALGSGGVILASSNGVLWTATASGTTANLVGAAFGNDLFVIVGDNGTILISTNGIDWATRSTTNLLRSVAFGNGLFVSFGLYWMNFGGILQPVPVSWRSANGVDWLSNPSPPAVPNSVVYGDGRFVGTVGGCAVGGCGAGGPDGIITSQDGIDWVQQWQGGPFYAVTFRPGLFVGAGQYGVDSGTQILTSVDGTNWVSRNTGFFSCYGLTTGNGGIVGVGGGFTPGGLGSTFLTSSDGSAWTSRGASRSTISTQNPIFLRSVAYGDATFVAVGDRGTIFQAVPAPIVLSARHVNQGFEISITSDIGRVCRIQSSPNLRAPAWNDVTWLTNSSGNTSYLDTNNADTPQKFYRALSP